MLFRIIHARIQITKLLIEPCPVFGEVYTKHYISKLLYAATTNQIYTYLRYLLVTPVSIESL